MPRVSVVIPAYNAERTVGQAIESVLAQREPDLQVTVIDDGSSDATAAVAASYGPPVECVRTENCGVSQARNEGIRRARGEFVALLDADDLWEPDKLELQLLELESRPDAGVCTTGSLRVDERLEPLGVVRAEDPDDACAALLLGSMVLGPVSSPLLRRQLIEQVGGFDPTFSQCADWDYFIRLSRRTAFAVIPDPLVRYRIGDESMSRDIGLLERDTFAVLDRFFSSDPPPQYAGLEHRCYSNHWMILAGSYLYAGRPVDAARCLARGVRAYPPNARRAAGLPGRWLGRARTRVLDGWRAQR